MVQAARIGIVAPSFQVPQMEFELGLRRLQESGVRLQVHSQCARVHSYFAGTDEERGEAFFEYAQDPAVDILWCARGGYGATRILPLLERLTAERGIPPKKLLAGYSDATALLEYARSRWGWSALHCPMPGLREFCLLKPKEWRSFLQFFEGEIPKQPWGAKKLRFAGKTPTRDIQAELVGGNLSVLASMIGTPFAPVARGKFVFFEDVDEPLYRLDRMAEQIAQSGMLSEARGIILGNFLNCRDKVRNVLAPIRRGVAPAKISRMIRAPRPGELNPARKKLDEKREIPEIFGALGERLGIPVAYGLGVGHGPDKFSLPIGAEYRLSREGRLEILSWDWKTERARSGQSL